MRLAQKTSVRILANIVMLTLLACDPSDGAAGVMHEDSSPADATSTELASDPRSAHALDVKTQPAQADEQDNEPPVEVELEDFREFAPPEFVVFAWQVATEEVVAGHAVPFSITALDTPVSGTLTALFDNGGQVVTGWELDVISLGELETLASSVDLASQVEAMVAMDLSGSIHLAFHSNTGDGYSYVSPPLYFHSTDGSSLVVYDADILHTKYRAGDFSAKYDVVHDAPGEDSEPLVVDRVVHGRVLSVRDGDAGPREGGV
jgi:hypothetical protein